MKKTVLFSVVFAGAACFADTTVTGSNTIGLLQVNDTAKEYLLVAVPWLDYGTGASDINVAELIKTANLAEGDKLYVSKNGGYDVYQLGSNNQWSPVKAVSIGADGKISTTSADSAASRTVSRGDAVWLQRSSTKGSFYLFGQQAESATASVTVKAGMNLVASPNADGLALASFTSGCAANDEIIVNGASGEEAHYYFHDGAWCTKSKSFSGGKPTTTWTATSATIPAGTGFWYKALANGTITL